MEYSSCRPVISKCSSLYSEVFCQKLLFSGFMGKEGGRSNQFNGLTNWYVCICVANGLVIQSVKSVSIWTLDKYVP